MKREPLLSRTTHRNRCWRNLIALFSCLALASWFYCYPIYRVPSANRYLEPLAKHCAQVPPISRKEFSDRQQTLANTLSLLGAAAYITEPSANTQFFANFSKLQWSLSERPLLLVISPQVNREADTVSTKVTILTPKFEATRARHLPLPISGINFAEWPEEGDPYSALLSALSISVNSTIYVDNGIRKFIVDGLQRVAPFASILSAPLEITEMRERKSEAEINILKCVNEATLLAIRQVRKDIYFGIRESQARRMMSTALSNAGLQDGGCLTLFGENAALPHGSGTDRLLAKTDLALFDCTASLHGYYSDVTRTVALEGSQISVEHLGIWEKVAIAQKTALAEARNGSLTQRVDLIARKVLAGFGYGQYFTHRLGHGIGLEIHEGPYLRGGSNDIIRVGHTFSDEPGVYIEGKVGVRLEDCFYIDEGGKAVYLTEGVGGSSTSPWKP